jgi:NAD(P)-dependent dehydrogenase (short-subunit alcohol dehydrogenase family)
VPNKHLSVYLNDHLAGAAAGLELLVELRKVRELEEWATGLHAEIAEDRQELKRVMRKAGVAASTPRQAVAWATEKAAALKIRLEAGDRGALWRLELLEALAIGIHGKRGLWHALQAAAVNEPALRAIDYARLIERAEDQRRRVEDRRLEAATEALGPPASVRDSKARVNGATDRAYRLTRSQAAWAAGGLVLGASVAARIARSTRARGFEGSVALITGGSRGLGLLLARELGRQGARLVLVARDGPELHRAQQDLRARNVDASVVVADVREEAEAQRVVSDTVTRHGRIDVLVNDAGIIMAGPIDHMSVADFEDAMATHFWGPLHTMRAAIPHMRRQGGGRIANISSIGGKVSVPHLAPYCASKFALTGLSDAARAELAREGIAITTVCPGLMRTGSPFNARFKGRHREEFAWFAVADSMPLLSIDARRAAAQIVDAIRHGDAELVITWPARLAVIATALMPNTVAWAMRMTNRALPSPDDAAGDEAQSGWQSTSRWAPSALTRLSERAAADNNEVPIPFTPAHAEPPA